MSQFRKLFPLLAIVFIYGCKQSRDLNETENTETITPVTVTSVTTGNLADTVALNATSVFLTKTSVNAVSSGYISDLNLQQGDKVSRGQILLKIRSKESVSVGNIINQVDTSFHFKGTIDVKSPANGYITELTHQQGDYVQEGESLAVVSDAGSLVFLLQLPYELSPYLAQNKHLSLTLPDGRKISGIVSSSMPFLDAASQTQSYVIRMERPVALPENLTATVKYIRKAKANAVSLPKDALLSNEQQTEFWIMKMIDSARAVKVPVKKGIETGSSVEILSPELKNDDKILLTGNYGLPDTANVKIEP
jgi:multidrug efflux pump subunit AcrA (membrane-fusion protein)